ncbi:MAG TPA: HAMP domain-containing sensor histidine kinase [Natronosporangium sp.]|nr:HAMP domain-containing sensor histidine kinase [Natronosporangium sp.]
MGELPPVPAVPGGGTLARRVVLATCLVALVSVLATALVAVPLAGRTATRQAAQALATEASLVAVVLRSPDIRPVAADRMARQLARQRIQLWLIRDGEADRPGLPAGVVAELTAGGTVTGRVGRVDGRLMLLEGRPLGGGDAVVLTRPLFSGVGAVVVGGLWLPLLAGLLAGALSGTLLARRLARPLRQAASAADRLRAGDRSVRVPVEPPRESAALAAALNHLAAALAASEGRQREFLLSISHELRTPLTTIRGYGEALADRVVDTDDVAGAGRIIRSEAAHLERLVTDLLALARLQADDFPLEIGTVDLVALVRGTAAAWSPRFDAAGVPWRTELPDLPALPVRTDAGRLRQVLDGLIGNALRVVPSGAPVVLALRPAPAAAPHGPAVAGPVGAGAVRDGAAGPAAGAVLEVRDGGPGLTEADLEVVFERGVLSSRYRGVRKVGSGLGLALAARLVRRMGGTIDAGHAPEGGARFTVTLPADPAAVPYKPRTRA